MELISVNIGQEQTLVRPNKTEQTGIFKRPVAGGVKITALGLPGDFIGDQKHHGGLDQAIYIYGTADYDWWAGELGREMPPGTFGENLTISGLASAEFNIGDRLQVGEATLQVTAPRIPCGTLAGRMGLPDFAKRFRHAERPGLYCRVIREGTVQSGDEVKWEKFEGNTISVLESMRDYYDPDLTESTIRRHLDAPIAIRTRSEKEAQLQKLHPGSG
jgi:MOSC domain-containing protein YiiM